MNDDVEKLWKNVVVALFKRPFQNLKIATTYLRIPRFLAGMKRATSRIRSRAVNKLKRDIHSE